jgi:crotonobetainyl-CoA:carnitine CoA-transferase CaiB-like acyl-CoA transferase
MAWIGPGPFCATLLGDLGAEIVKIFEPNPERRGALAKYAFPDVPGFPGVRNCKTMGIDLKAEDGRAVFHDLARTADVIMEGFRPGVTDRLGVGYETIRKINRGIVYASITGYGQDGPYRDLAGHDINYISVGGLLGMTGTAGGPPTIPGTLIGDFAAGGMSAAIGILAALMARHDTGEGQHVDVSLTDGVAELMGGYIGPYLSYGVAARRGEAMLTGERPWYNVYETKDGKYLSVGALEPWFYANLCRLLGREDLVEHQFAEGEKKAEIFRFFTETFLTKTRDEWMQVLGAEDTCVAPVYTVDEVGSDPHLIARGMIREEPHPTLGTVKQVGSMVKLSDSPFEVRNWCRAFGQHTEEILLELGYTAERIAVLREADAIQ